MLDCSNYLAKSKYHDNSNKVVIRKMGDETTDVAIEEFVELKPKMYSYLVNDNSKHNKAKGVSHNEYKDVLLNKNFLRYSLNRIQSKYHKIGTYEINRISLSCIDDKINIQNSGCDGLVLVYQNNYKTYLNNY